MTATSITQNSSATITNDPNINNSWYLDGSTLSDLQLDIESVWDDYDGSGVSVGVIDTQIFYNHTELSDAYDLQLDYNFALGTGDLDLRNKDFTDSHGTRVAGVISAEADNDTGSAGVASGAQLIGLAIDYSHADVGTHIEDALRAAVDVDVVNNSWSFNTNFYDNFSRSDAESYGEALEYLASEGRDGLGTSVVFSAGNGGSEAASNYHNFQNSPYTIAVGAVSSDGTAWEDSSLGANVLVSAAGEDVYTTNLSNQQATVDGTSFSAPAVTGIIALMYEANPNLGYRDVQEILALSAVRDGLSDDAGDGHGWVTNGANSFNGGGLHFSDSFGYGFVNAHNAVRLAETWTEQNTASDLETITVENDENAYLVAGSQDHISMDFEVTEDILVEHVQLSMDLVWRSGGDLEVFLTSAEGVQIQLMYETEDREYVGVFRNFTFSSVASLGELGAGTWTLDIYNTNPELVENGVAMEGVLHDATLEILGSTDGINDNTYVFTNEFGTQYSGADLVQRSSLSDTDGGIDTINAAAVTSNSHIDISGETDSQIAGVTVEIQEEDNLFDVDVDTVGDALIENVFTGDGDDTLIGNVADNTLSGGRGNDTLHWSEGDDILQGGEGYDTFSIEAELTTVYAALSEAGVFLIGLVETGISQVFGVEAFSFGSITITAAELTEWIEAGKVPDVDTQTPNDDTSEDTGSQTEEPQEEPEEAVEPEETTAEAPETNLNQINGTNADDLITATSEDDHVFGGNGEDILRGRTGDDVIEGGNGDDRVLGQDGDDIGYGGDGRDRIIGHDGNDILFGGAGADVLRGGDGSDQLSGGADRDVLFGGSGADVFIFDLENTSAFDIVRDFNRSEGDQILISSSAADTLDDFTFVQRNDHTFLEYETDGESVRVMRIDNTDADTLTITGDALDGYSIV